MSANSSINSKAEAQRQTSLQFLGARVVDAHVGDVLCIHNPRSAVSMVSMAMSLLSYVYFILYKILFLKNLSFKYR